MGKEANIAENPQMDTENTAEKCDVMKTMAFMLQRYCDVRVFGTMMGWRNKKQYI